MLIAYGLSCAVLGFIGGAAAVLAIGFLLPDPRDVIDHRSKFLDD